LDQRFFRNFLYSLDYLVTFELSTHYKIIGSAKVEYVIALLVGILITNLSRIPSWLKDSAMGELFIKTAIVLLGAKILLISLVTSAPTILAAAFLSFSVV
jgi:hypothetical protein